MMTLVGCLTRVRLIDTVLESWVSNAYHQAIRYSFIQELVDGLSGMKYYCHNAYELPPSNVQYASEEMPLHH
jgi:hypothetical protein